MNEALHVNNISFSLAKKQILNQVTFDLTAGNVLGLIGHNGAGKTTLFHLILALKFVQKGTIKIFGESNLCHSVRKRVGYITERPYLNLEDTLNQVLSFSAMCNSIDAKTLSTRVTEVAKIVGLEKNIDQKLNSYSKGMLQRSLIAQSLIGDPELLIMDEPMSGLDPEGRMFIRKMMQSWKASGKTILFSSHALEDVELLADQVLVLDGGNQKFYGSLADWKALGSAQAQGGSLA